MPTWLAVVLGLATLVALVEVVRRMRGASRLRLADDLARTAGQLSELADDVDANGSAPARAGELAEAFGPLIEFLGGNSLLYEVKDDLLVALGAGEDAPVRLTARQAQARKLTLEVQKLLEGGNDLSAATDKLRRVSGLFDAAAAALKNR